MSDRILSWYTKSKNTSNQYCLYCGRYIGPNSNINSNREHLIGRNFVPKGTLSEKNSFNFIFRACEDDNHFKSELERHISSISLFAAATQGDSSKEVEQLALHKASKDYHPDKQGIKVIDSQEKLEFSFIGNNFKLNFTVIGPPQPNQAYIKCLAFMQMQALFSLLSTPRPYNNKNLLLLPDKYFYFLDYWPKSDWGNVILNYLTKAINEWEQIAIIRTAKDNFKTIIKCDPISKLWFWALEWNKSFRIAGFIGSIDLVENFIAKLPKEDIKIIQEEINYKLSLKTEIALKEDEDELFSGIF